MTHPTPRNHAEKPSTPPTGPSGVSHQPADSSPPTPINLTEEVARMTAIVEQNLRVLLDTFGITYTESPPAPAPAPHHLDAMREAWGEGYYDGRMDGRNDDRHIDGYDDSVTTVNPYGKLLDDRREFVRKQVNNGYGAQLDENDDDVLGDDNAEWFDALLDAHDEWLALQRNPGGREYGVDNVRAEQAETRVAELDSALRSVLDAVNNLDTGYNAVKINGVRIALARAGYGTHPDTGEKR
ncbi:hypothetical protein SEA_BARB_79 [Gordonia phage Barb]|uniref:Uncharacterized protein n=1 Tax=Gordonia phage Barb TaxID=2588128 RepID=A0A4Y5U072_9CAUD|nr:hypothetical protein KNU55_gp79 [Gordonia phage Barb]QDB74755.1 hypothetical protein SEA_BARB_79 [Gordonia phage Barb]QXO14458.1 hypothetical protein SEA_FUGAX_80 [Gordonia phage Fugax]WNM73193.1 hypothetical protein SEA_CLAMCHOWDER_79 [Gordonia phage ClamChowder]